MLDWSTKTWRTERPLPRLLTGLKMVVTNNRPTVLGRYNFEKQNLVWRYQAGSKLWQTLETRLPGHGKRCSQHPVLSLEYIPHPVAILWQT